jgi:hypothetical protein
MMGLYFLARRFVCLTTGTGMLGIRIEPKLAQQSSDLVKPIRDIGGVAVQAKMTALRAGRRPCPRVRSFEINQISRIC